MWAVLLGLDKRAKSVSGIKVMREHKLILDRQSGHGQ